MQIYECGLSVLAELSSHILGYKTYCCVIDAPQQKTATLGFLEMCKTLSEQGVHIVSFDEAALSVKSKNGDVYTLAHEIIVTDTILTNKPSNILRHIFSRCFIVETLYYDENHELVDLTQKGFRAAKDGNISYIDREKAYSLLVFNPDLLVDFLELRLRFGFYTNDYLAELLGDFESNKTIKDLERVKALFENYPDKIFKELNTYPYIYKYLTDICGMRHKIEFVTPEVKVTTHQVCNVNEDFIQDNEREERINHLRLPFFAENVLQERRHINKPFMVPNPW